ncbi:Macrolide export protein MacA [subsurface metagenome]
MRKWGTIGTILLLCLALLSATSCGGTQEETTQQLIDVVRGDLIVSVSGSGNIVASDEANLVFGTSGKITRIYVDEGDKVSEGEVLARLETGPLELALTQAQVALTGQELAVSQAEVNVKNAEIALERAEDSWLDTKSAGSKVKRLKKYLEYHLENHPEDTAEILSIQRSLREAWERFLLVATDSVDSRQVTAKEMELELAKQSVEQMKHSLEQFRQAVAEAQKQLDEATIHAPFGGVVASIDAEEGDIFSPTGMPVIHLIDPDIMEIEVEIDEIDIAEVQAGQRAIIEVDALPTLQLEGEVTSISTLSIEMGGLVLYEVTIGFDVPQGYNLKIGMSAIADIILEGQSNVLLVPNRAISQDSQGNPVVKVMVNEEIEERPVVPGISDGFNTEIVSGLSEGDVIVIETKAKSSDSGGLFG